MEKLGVDIPFTIRVEELRDPVAEDQRRIQAERGAAAGKRLLADATKESLRAALTSFEEALHLWEGLHDPVGEGLALHYLGVLHNRLDEKQEALAYLEKALARRREAGDPRAQAETLTAQGITLDELGNKPQAGARAKDALTLWRAAGDVRGEAESRNHLGEVLASIGEPQQALESFNQSLAVARQTGDKAFEATVLTNIGGVYDVRGDKQIALQHFEQALGLAHAAVARALEAALLHNIGGLYNDLGEKQKALDFLDRGRRGFQAVGDVSGEGNALNIIGNVYGDLNDHEDALQIYELALERMTSARDAFGVATVLNNMGYSNDHLGRKRDALRFYSEALEKTRALKDPTGQGYALHNLASVHSDLGHYAQAIALEQLALPLKRNAGDRRGVAQSLQGLGVVSGLLGQPLKALDYLHQARQMFVRVGDRAGEADALYRLARAQQDLGRLSEARASVESAVATVETLRRLVASFELRASYLASVNKYYVADIDILMRLDAREPRAGHAAAALHVNEQRRARALLETIAEGRVDVREGVEPALLAEEQQLQTVMAAKAAAVERAVSAEQPTDRVASARKELDQLLVRHDELISRIRLRSPRYAALAQPEPLDAASIQRQVLDDDSVLLEYALGDTQSYLWVVTRQVLRSFTLPGQNAIEEAARRATKLLADPRDPTVDQERLDARYWEAARALSRMILEPAASIIAGKRLLIVADGALQYVSFAALPDPREVSGRSNLPLVVTNEIVSAPSASTIAILRRETAGRAPAPHSLRVFADPVFEAGDPRVGRVAREMPPPSQPGALPARESALTRSARDVNLLDGGSGFPRLLFTRREANAIATFAADSVTDLDFDATRARALSGDLRDYRLLHFATHGLMNAMHPQLSGLVLSLVDPQGHAKDGFLRLYRYLQPPSCR